MLKSAAKTDCGLARDKNEDCVYQDPANGIYIVIDGVGGQAAGEVASETALTRILARLKRRTGSVEERIREAITIANNEIYRMAKSKEEWRTMACVLTVSVVADGATTIGHVGDTRLYKVHNGQIRKLTSDHSPVGEREDACELSEIEAMMHPRRNEVYRDVGTELHEPEDENFIEVVRTGFEPDSALLMCSDGLSDLLKSSAMLQIIERYGDAPERVVDELVIAANEAGGSDNITALFVAGERFAASGKSRSSWFSRGKRSVLKSLGAFLSALRIPYRR